MIFPSGHPINLYRYIGSDEKLVGTCRTDDPDKKQRADWIECKYVVPPVSTRTFTPGKQTNTQT